MYFEQIGVLLKAILGNPTTAEYGAPWTAGMSINSGDYAIVSTSSTLMIKYISDGTTDSTNEPDLSSANVGDTGTDGTATYVVVEKLYSHIFGSTVCTPSFCVQNTLKDDCGSGSKIIERYNGCKAKSANLSIAPDGDFNISIDIVGMKFRDSITDGITELDETNKIQLPATRIKNAFASLNIDGSTYKLAKDFSLTIDRGTEAEYTLGTGANAGLVSDKQVIVNGSMSSLFDTSVYTKAKNESTVSFDITITDGDNSLTFTVAEAKFSFKTESKKVGEKYPLNLDWSAFKQSAAEKIKVELINTVSNY